MLLVPLQCTHQESYTRCQLLQPLTVDSTPLTILAVFRSDWKIIVSSATIIIVVVFRTPTTALPQLKVSQSWVEDLGSSQQQFKVNIRLTMIDVEYFDTTLFSLGRRRLSSNADMPDYGSWCSLQRRWMSMVENSLSPSEYNNQSHPDMNLQHFGIKSTSLCQNDSLKYALYS